MLLAAWVVVGDGVAAGAGAESKASIRIFLIIALTNH
jgi:hypothetical protein